MTEQKKKRLQAEHRKEEAEARSPGKSSPGESTRDNLKGCKTIRKIGNMEIIVRFPTKRRCQ